jgi:hypothetical protein
MRDAKIVVGVGARSVIRQEGIGDWEGRKKERKDTSFGRMQGTRYRQTNQRMHFHEMLAARRIRFIALQINFFMLISIAK